jgi:antitoxin component YwqK of YwqJK toxin-antitoxin module
MLDGMRHGKGKFFYKEGSYYDGEWKNNKMHGFGTLYYPDGCIAYQGEWKDD